MYRLTSLQVRNADCTSSARGPSRHVVKLMSFLTSTCDIIFASTPSYIRYQTLLVYYANMAEIVR